MPWRGWLLLFYMGCIIAGLALMLSFEAINHLGCEPVAMFNNLSPIFTIALAALLLKEKLVWYHTIGIILTLGGVLVSIREHPQKKKTCHIPGIR
nr:DMT family transporter [Moorella sulfitireducens]